MTELGMKYTCGVNFLLERNALHSGWVKKIKDGNFGKSMKRKYAVLHQGLLYLFDDDESLATNDILHLPQFKLINLERGCLNSKWGFSFVKIGNHENITFTVGSEREHKEWIKVLQDWKILSYDGDNQENEYVPHPALSEKIDTSPQNVEREKMPSPPMETKTKKVSLPGNYEITEVNTNPTSLPPIPLPKPKQEVRTPESEDFYAEPDSGDQRDYSSEYLPATVFQWKLDRNGAKQLLDECGTPGVYLIRKGKDSSDVISAFLLGDARHYKIFVEGEEMYLKSDHPRFRKHVDLIMYYHLNNLPTCHARLETPYSPDT